MPIETVEELHDHLELAIRIELATIPPYLYAMYSIVDQGSEAALLLRSIVVEEMLHASLVTNLLLATNGTPDFAGTKYVTEYPVSLPHHVPPLLIDLAPCSLDLIKGVFMRIEQPAPRSSPAQADQFETLGQFYHALEIGIETLSDRVDLFAYPQIDAQLSNHEYYKPVAHDADDSGGLVQITDQASALEAIEIIVHQGEGLSDERWADPAHHELTHYHKLLQITEGTSPLGEVHPVGTNPRRDDYLDVMQPVADLFNAAYRGLFLVLDRMFSEEANQSRAVGVLYILMADVMSQLADFLVRQPAYNGTTTAPTFELYEFTTEQPLNELIEMSEIAAELHPELTTVHDALRGLGFIL